MSDGSLSDVWKQLPLDILSIMTRHLADLNPRIGLMINKETRDYIENTIEYCADFPEESDYSDKDAFDKAVDDWWEMPSTKKGLDRAHELADRLASERLEMVKMAVDTLHCSSCNNHLTWWFGERTGWHNIVTRLEEDETDFDLDDQISWNKVTPTVFKCIPLIQKQGRRQNSMWDCEWCGMGIGNACNKCGIPICPCRL